MPKPTYYPGDEVLIESNGPYEGLSKVLEGQYGVIVRNLGPELRAKGSKVSSAYYRVYIPELDVERSIKGHFLKLVRRSLDEEEAVRQDKWNRQRVRELEDKRLALYKEGSSEAIEEEFGTLGDAMKFYKAHGKKLE